MSKTAQQATLFENADERAAAGDSLIVASIRSQAKSSDRQQAAFQRLIKQIDDQRTQIEDWRLYHDRYNQRLAGELMPLYVEIRKKRCAMLRLLDAQFQQRNAIRGKVLRRKLSAMILELARDLLSEQHDKEIVELHDKYSDLSHSEEAELEQAFSRDMIESMFGVRLDEGEGEPASFEEMLLKAAKLKQEEAEQRPPRRKSAKAAAAEEKREAAEKQVSQTVREVYRKLASTLHPDRASHDLSPEQKTALMQRVNRAYDSGNLLELLNIQLEIEQIDAAHLANMPAERVAHFNQVLREQLAELKAELDSLLAPFRALVPYQRKLQPAHVDQAMAGEIARMKVDLRQIDDELAAFQDAGKLSAALKEYEEDDGLDDLDGFLALEALLGSAPMNPPRRQRKR